MTTISIKKLLYGHWNKKKSYTSYKIVQWHCSDHNDVVYQYQSFNNQSTNQSISHACIYIFFNSYDRDSLPWH